MTKYLKLFIVENPSSRGYHDTYDSMVVAAESEEEARQWHPNGDYPSGVWDKLIGCDWSKPDKVNVTYLGIATSDVEAGVVCYSFNAG